jgi:hypothetical protein
MGLLAVPGAQDQRPGFDIDAGDHRGQLVADREPWIAVVATQVIEIDARLGLAADVDEGLVLADRDDGAVNLIAGLGQGRRDGLLGLLELPQQGLEVVIVCHAVLACPRAGR